MTLVELPVARPVFQRLHQTGRYEGDVLRVRVHAEFTDAHRTGRLANPRTPADRVSNALWTLGTPANPRGREPPAGRILHVESQDLPPYATLDGWNAHALVLVPPHETTEALFKNGRAWQTLSFPLAVGHVLFNVRGNKLVAMEAQSELWRRFRTRPAMSSDQKRKYRNWHVALWTALFDYARENGLDAYAVTPEHAKKLWDPRVKRQPWMPAPAGKISDETVRGVYDRALNNAAKALGATVERVPAERLAPKPETNVPFKTWFLSHELQHVVFPPAGQRAAKRGNA